MTIDLKPVESSNLHAVGYDPEKGELHVQFSKWTRDQQTGERQKVPGATYRYFDVAPQIHEAFMAHNAHVLDAKEKGVAPSRGLSAHFNEHIKNGGFKYEKLS